MAIVRAPHDLSMLAESILGELMASVPLQRLPRLVWRNYRVTAGTANHKDWTIALSVSLLTDKERLRETLVHEFAHLVAFSRVGKRGWNHGLEWQLAMHELGAQPVVRHQYEVRRNSRTQVVWYLCERCHAKIQRARRLPRRKKYLHLGCGGAIKFLSVEVQIEPRDEAASLA